MLYYVEMTDTFGGEANYSWVSRHIIKANTERGAVNRFARISCLNWRCVGNYGDSKRYDSASGASCYFISQYDPEQHAQFCFLDTDEREETAQ